MNVDIVCNLFSYILIRKNPAILKIYNDVKKEIAGLKLELYYNKIFGECRCCLFINLFITPSNSVLQE